MSDKQHSSTRMEVHIPEMHCKSCEVLIEQGIGAIPGVCKVEASADSGRVVIHCVATEPSLEALQAAIKETGYKIQRAGGAEAVRPQNKPSVLEIIALVSVVYILGVILSRLGIFDLASTISDNMTVGAAIVLGLVAGTSSCMAVAGGLYLSAVARIRMAPSPLERVGVRTGEVRAVPPPYQGGGYGGGRILAFISGRVIGYTVFGALIGLIGQSFVPSATLTGILMVLAALYMIIAGLDMLHLAPAWMLKLLPKMPKSVSKKLLGERSLFLLGAATFFLPCGFTQGLQIYALTTGSALTSGLILGGFALGTAPALLALGFASSSLKGQAGYWFFRFSGVVVVILGLLNLRNGLTVIGFDSSSLVSTVAVSVSDTGSITTDPNVTFDGQTQIIKMRLAANPSYLPSDHYTVKAGVPVHIEIDGRGTGCRSVFTIPKLGLSVPLNKDVNTLDFTPKNPGTLTFSCSMGMYPGTITVAS